MDLRGFWFVFQRKKNMKHGLTSIFSMWFYIKVNQIWKNVWESILSKFDSIFKPKSREIKFKLAQARPKIFRCIRYLIPIM